MTMTVDAESLARIAAEGWPALETEPLGDWLLRASSGFTRRANSVLALGDPSMPLEAALARVHAWYAARSLPAYVQLFPGSALDHALAHRGWTIEAPVAVQIAPIASILEKMGAASESDSAEVRDDVDPAWVARYHKAGALHEPALRVLRGGPRVLFASIRGDDPARARAIGRCVLVGAWAGFSAIEVDPAHRRRGLAHAIMRALLERAAAHGCTNAYLQVETDNTAALALYERLQFVTHHHYHYRRMPIANSTSMP
ncbi:GNAT family N-acetyltransferase [Pendulispora brunnea]|uniref:GNAT family N-acetyltransferase n=1 Tax=Pendulispora brunnea TaxID=2905690 RepID=A0ABZ2JY17_9BACT